ncbi:MAG TPA: sugar transferase [Verrucomicrobiae bacterium]|nr:sugar transferase [Verrucomicrobiae bacterium]
MIVSRSSRFPRKKLLLATGDAICTALAMVAAVMLRLGWNNGLEYLQLRQGAILISWAVFVLAFYIGGLYESNRLQNLGRTFGAAVISVALGSMLITGVFFAALSIEIGRGIFLGFAAFVFVAVVSMRMMYMAASRRGFMAQRCLIIGTTTEARKAIELIGKHAHANLRILGLIHCGTDRDRIGRFFDDYPVLGTLDTLERFVELYDVERLVLAAGQDAEPVLLRQLRSFRYRGIELVDFVALSEELAQEIPLDHINDEWLFMASMNNSRIHIRRLKRLTDIIVSSVGLLLTAPMAALASILIKLDSPGPILFKQERLGRESVPFTLFKFRTMRVDAESQTGPVWATDNDPRATRIGKWLRKFRVDEIPQLLNVLRGDMSLVGPRPEREIFIRKLSEKIPFYAERLLVPPGISGWAQVMYPYAASIEESRRKLQFDLYYIKHMSFFLDMYVLLKTFKTILFGRERPRATKTAEAKPRHAPVKTETLTFSPSNPSVKAEPDSEAPGNARPQTAG